MDEKDRKCGFGVNDCPIWLYKLLTTNAKQLYNNQYWVVILDWYRKAQAYDMLCEGQVYQETPEPENVIEEKEEPKVKLFGKGE